MYEFFQRHGLRASEENFAWQAKVLGQQTGFWRIFAQSQLHPAGLINSSNLSTFDQTSTDLVRQSVASHQAEARRVHFPFASTRLSERRLRHGCATSVANM